MSYEFIKYPEAEPEGTAQERLWQSVLMDFPYYAGASSNQSAFVQASRAGSFAAGHLAKGSTEQQAYVSRWIFAGFTPYMYWALRKGIKSAAEHAPQLCKDADDLLRLEERMHWLGVLFRTLGQVSFTTELRRQVRENGRSGKSNIRTTSFNWSRKLGRSSPASCSLLGQVRPFSSTSTGTRRKAR